MGQSDPEVGGDNSLTPDREDGNVSAAPCTCPTLPTDREVRRFDVAPLAGGGWDAWAVALQRLLVRLVDGLTHCVIVSQGCGGRYVQWMIGHRRAHLEVSSNHYLDVHHQLTIGDERHLRTLGFSDPRGADRSSGARELEQPGDDRPVEVDEDDDARWPRNWLLDLDLGDDSAIARMAGLVEHLVEDIALFDPRRSVTVEQFLAEHPCAHCSWGAAGA